MKKEKNDKKQKKEIKEKKKIDKYSLFSKILATFLVVFMVLGTCYTFIYLLLNS